MNQKLIDYLPDLITHFDCVIIPEFGGFVTENASASIQSGNIQPPKKTILFNPLLNHNDGLLANYIAKKENISYVDALASIKEEVDIWKEQLENGSNIKIPKLGSFYLLNDHLIFKADADETFLIESFGLSGSTTTSAQNIPTTEPIIVERPSVAVPTMPVNPANTRPSEEHKEKKEKAIWYLPILNFFNAYTWYILLGIIALLLVYTIYTFKDQWFQTKPNIELQDSTSYNDSLNLLKDSLDRIAAEIDTAQPKKPIVSKPKESTDELEQSSSGIIEIIDTSANKIRGTYHCVASGAFKNERDALVEKQQLEMVGFNAEVIKIRNGIRYQVIIGRYQNYNDAVNELKFAKAIDTKFYLITVKDVD